MVVTVEPGIYFNEVSLSMGYNSTTQGPHLNKEVIDQYMNVGGVRIEDTILITEDGYKVLSSAAPKEISEIEAVMHSGNSEDG